MMTKEKKLEQIEEAKECYKEAQKLIAMGDELIAKSMEGVEVCRVDDFEPIHYMPHKGAIHIHLYSGISKLAELFGVKMEPYISITGSKSDDRMMICVGGVEFMQIGTPRGEMCYE